MMNSLLTTILGLDLKDFLLHLFNFLLLVTIVGLLVYKPVIRFVRARKEGIEKQEKEHNEKMEEAEKTKSQYTDLIGSAEHDIAAKAEETLAEAKLRAEKILQEAEEEAKNEKVKAITAMKGEVAEVAVMIASGILDKEITPEENAKIIDDCLKEWDESHD